MLHLVNALILDLVNPWSTEGEFVYEIIQVDGREVLARDLVNEKIVTFRLPCDLDSYPGVGKLFSADVVDGVAMLHGMCWEC